MHRASGVVDKPGRLEVSTQDHEPHVQPKVEPQPPSTSTVGGPPNSVPGNGDWEQWVRFYNDRNKQDSDDVKKYFSNFQFVSELIEIEQSVERRKRAVVNFGGIELTSVSLNKGNFWIVASKGEGWVFPILKKRGRGYWDAINSLFNIGKKSSEYKYIEIKKPAVVIWSENKVWKLENKGEIELKTE